MLRTISRKETETIEKLRELQIVCWEIKNKAGGSKNGKKCLSREDAEFIINNYRKMPTSEIAQKLKKGVFTIKEYAKVLNLSCLFVSDFEMLYNSLYRTLTGRHSYKYDFGIAEKYGIPIYYNNGFKTVILPEFMSWFEAHRQLINLAEYKTGVYRLSPNGLLTKFLQTKEPKRTNAEYGQPKKIICF